MLSRCKFESRKPPLIHNMVRMSVIDCTFVNTLLESRTTIPTMQYTIHNCTFHYDVQAMPNITQLAILATGQQLAQGTTRFAIIHGLESGLCNKDRYKIPGEWLWQPVSKSIDFISLNDEAIMRRISIQNNKVIDTTSNHSTQ